MNDDATGEAPVGPRLSRVLRSVIVWTLVAGAAYLLWPTGLGGCTTLTIVSGHSMEPTYHTGDVVLSRCGTPQIGDVVVYQPTDLDGVRIIHRVIGGDGEAGWRLQGDNNDFVDAFAPVDAEVLGVAKVHLPKVGLWMKALANPWVWLSMITLAVALVTWPGRDRQDGESEPGESEPEEPDDQLGDHEPGEHHHADGPEGVPVGAAHARLVHGGVR